MGLLLGAHGISAALGRVPQAALLDHTPTGLDDFNLAFDLVFKSRADKAEAVQVLHFGLGAEALRASETDTYIGITTKRTLLHVAVRDAAVEQDFLEAGEIFEGLVGGANVGLGDDLGQRRATAVQVDISAGGGVRESLVETLAGVLFHVQAGDADALCSSVGRGNLDESMLGDGLVELRDLVALGQVGIEVIFAGEDGALTHLAVDGQRGQRGKLDGLLVEHRQGAGQAQANRADVGIGG